MNVQFLNFRHNRAAVMYWKLDIGNWKFVRYPSLMAKPIATAICGPISLIAGASSG